MRIAAWLAFFDFSTATTAQEWMLGIAAVITIVGTALCWHAPHHRMSMEERAKDGRVTEEEARRRILIMRWSGPIVTVFGCGMLLFVWLR